MLSGCSSTASTFSFSHWPWDKQEKNELDENQDSNPFRQTALKKQNSVDPVSQSNSNELQTPPFDAATMMLIETEFKDATVEERKRWYEELRQVPPEMVPRLIRARRLAMQYEDMDKVAQAATRTPSSAADSMPVITNHQQSALQSTTSAQTTATGNPTQPAVPVHELKPGDTMPALAEHSGSQPELIEQTGLSTGGKTLKPQPGKIISPEERYQTALKELITLSEQNLPNVSEGSGSTVSLEDLREHINLRMLYLMSHQEERSLEAVPGLSHTEQEFWQKTFWGLSNYFDQSSIPDQHDRATHTVSQLSDAIDHLRDRAHLEIRNVTFSKGIHGFGNYDRFDKDEFRPGQPVLVYAEMQNFYSELTSEGMHKTVLKSTVEIHRAGSQPGLITSQEYAPTEDYCRTRRHDYFHSYKINLPPELTVGPYVLKLIVEDQLSNKVATYTINFMVI